MQVDWERCGYCRQYGVYQVDMIGDYLGTKLYWAIWIIGLFEMWVYTMRRNIIAPCVRSPIHSSLVVALSSCAVLGSSCRLVLLLYSRANMGVVSTTMLDLL